MSLLKQKAIFNFSVKKTEQQKKINNHKILHTFVISTFVGLGLFQYELNALTLHLEKKIDIISNDINTNSVLNQALNNGDQEKIILNAIKLKYSDNRTGNILYLVLLNKIINNTSDVQKITDSTKKILLATSTQDIGYGINMEISEDTKFLNSCPLINPICLLFRNKINKDVFIPNNSQTNKKLNILQYNVSHSKEYQKYTLNLKN